MFFKDFMWYLGRVKDVEYWGTFAETQEKLFVTRHKTKSINKFLGIKYEREIIEKQYIMVIPDNLLLYLKDICDDIDEFKKTLDNPEEWGKEHALPFKLEDYLITNLSDEDFEKAFDAINDAGGEVRLGFKDDVIASGTFDKHSLDKDLKELDYTKMCNTGNKSLIKKEYSLRLGHEYSISINCVVYYTKGNKKVILESVYTMAPYEIFKKLIESK